MNRRILTSFLFVVVFTVCHSLALAAECTTNTPKENCVCAGWYYFSGEYNESCSQCSDGTYSTQSGTTNTSCSSCTNNLPQGANYTGPGTTPNNCPWKLTCSANTYFDNNEKECVPCSDGYESSKHTVEYDGDNTPNDSNACHPKSCIAGQYRSDKTQNCEPCPTGSTSKGGATSITDCYMDETTIFYTADGYQIPFETVFGDDVTISYDATDE